MAAQTYGLLRTAFDRLRPWNDTCKGKRGRGAEMADNRGVVYMGAGKVEVQDIDFPKLELTPGPGVPKANEGRKAEHGAILKIVSTNICGTEQHMVRGRPTAPEGLILGH